MTELVLAGGGSVVVRSPAGVALCAEVVGCRIELPRPDRPGGAANIDLTVRGLEGVFEQNARMHADNHALQCVVHDLKCDLAGGVEAFEAGRRAALGEAVRLLEDWESRGIRDSGRRDREGEPDEAEWELTRAEAFSDAAEKLRALCRRPAPHPPHELQARLEAAEARALAAEQEAARLRALCDMRGVATTWQPPAPAVLPGPTFLPGATVSPDPPPAMSRRDEDELRSLRQLRDEGIDWAGGDMD